MARRETKASKRRRGTQAARKAKPVLGNDPFERGAAPRPSSGPAAVFQPGMAPAGAHGAPAADVDTAPLAAEVVTAEAPVSGATATDEVAALAGQQVAAAGGVAAAEDVVAAEVVEAAEEAAAGAAQQGPTAALAEEVVTRAAEEILAPLPAGATGEDTGAPSRLGRPALEDARERLAGIESRVESAAASAASRLGELARQEASGQHAGDLLRMAARSLPALRERLASLASLRSFFVGTRELDPFGMDRELAERAMPIIEFLYTTWWRVETRQIDNVPASGPVVLVANHGGVLPWDALVLRLALLRHWLRSERDVRPLLDEHALGMPVAGKVMARLGAVPATAENATKLLEGGAAIGVFPEGSRSANRPWPDRYRIQRFGRGGFAKIALRSGAPVVPCAIVGSEETSLPMARAGWLSGVLGMPFLKSPPAVPLAALGIFPLPARWSLRFGTPVDTAALGPEAAEDPGHVLEITERVRSTLQQMLDEDVAARGSVYL